MASANKGPMSSTNRLDDLLICPICLDRFTEPKTLACLHTFCSSCLESCRRPYRRDIVCPVCKRITMLPNLGVQALQSDFRIEQLRDILDSQLPPTTPSPPASPGQDDRPSEDAWASRRCSVCESESRESAGQWHCPQCLMYYCEACITQRHNTNVLFASHTPIDLTAAGDEAWLRCATHAGQLVRFVCRPCAAVLCTLCALRHDPSHRPDVIANNGSVGQLRTQLRKQLRGVNVRLAELQTRVKYLSTVRDSQQGALREATAAIGTRTNALLEAVRTREAELIADAKKQVEKRLTEAGLDRLADIRFQVNGITQLCSEVNAAADGTPQQCLIAYDRLMAQMTATTNADLPTVAGAKADNGIRFVPATDGINSIIGTLHDYRISHPPMLEGVAVASHSGNIFSSCDAQPKVTPRRLSSILGALSPSRKEPKLGRVKASAGSQPTCRSPNSTINVDELISIVSPEVRAVSRPLFSCRLLFSLNQDLSQLGFPSSVALFPDGRFVVAQADSGLQLFDAAGDTVRFIGCGEVGSVGVAALPDGQRVAVTDEKHTCVKVYDVGGECRATWGAFTRPSGIAVAGSGVFVVTDVAQHAVSLHAACGTQLTRFGEWGSGDLQFNEPTHVAVDHTTGNFVVSDSGNHCIKVFSGDGAFIRRFPFVCRNDQFPKQPHGVAVDGRGNIAIADRNGHRVCLFSGDGVFMQELLTEQDGVRYPVDICIARQLGAQSMSIAVVEAYRSFFTNGMHHSVKVFAI